MDLTLAMFRCDIYVLCKLILPHRVTDAVYNIRHCKFKVDL